MSAAITGARKATKAIYAGIAQLIAGLVLVTVDGTTLGEVSTNQWLIIAGATLAAGGGVYGLSNKSS